jgi:thioesterase domain-containing protein
VAYEIARLLEADGERVALLALLSASAGNIPFAPMSRLLRLVGGALGLSPSKQAYVFGRLTAFAVGQGTYSIRALVPRLVGKGTVIAAELGRLARMSDASASPDVDPGADRPRGSPERMRRIYHQIDRSYLPGQFGGRVTLIFGREEVPDALAERDWWRKVAADVEVFEVPGDRQTKLTRHVDALADVLDRLLERSASEPSIRDNAGTRTQVAARHRC